MRPDWRNRHVSRVEKPEYLTWADMRPVCPLCGFGCMTALNVYDYPYILEDHFTVCRSYNMSDDKGWKFTGKPFLRFTWEPTHPQIFWAYVVTVEGPRMLGGYQIRDERTTPPPDRAEAMEASKRFVRMWEAAARTLKVEDLTDYHIRWIASRKYNGDWVPITHPPREIPDDYYVHRRTEADRHNIEVVAAMLGDAEWAEAAWLEFRPGRTPEETLGAIALALAKGELVRPDVPDNAVDTASSISNGSGIVDPEVMGIFS